MVPLVQQMQNCIDRQQSCYRQKKKNNLVNLVAKKLGGQKKLGGLQALLKNGALNITQHPRLLNYACL